MKIHSKKYLIENSSGILSSVHDKLNEISLEGTSTPDFKEGMVVYFSSLPSNTLEQIEKKLKEPKDRILLNLPEPNDQKYYGSKSFNLVKKAISHLSKDKITDQNEVRLYSNGLSIAKSIQDIYRKPVQADRGETFNRIRSYAIELVKKQIENFPGKPDKWCPADIYIYNDNSSVNKIFSAEFLNIGEKSLNAQFQSDIKKTGKGILGISLKEEKAQGGAGGSFEKSLTRKENYPESKKIQNYSVLSVAYHYDKSIKNKNKPTGIGEISTAHASARRLASRKVQGAENVVTELQKTLELTLGKKDLSSALNNRGNYDKKTVESIFQSKQLEKVKYSSGLDGAVKGMFKVLMRQINDEYNKTRDQFYSDLKEAGFNPPSTKIDAKKLGVKNSLAKAGCYKTASYLINGLNAGKLQIPQEFKTIINQKNVFVALTAYAIGMAGISPTFFKMIGTSTPGENANIETFYGDGFLNLDDDSDVVIKDSPKRLGFNVKFITKVTLENDKNSKTVKKYEVNISFQSGGDMVTVSVSQLKETE